MGNTIDAIVELEWRMFDTTQNEGGRAPCQEDRRTFEIMRRSHLLAWSEQLASGWLGDLAAAEAAGRNLMAEKYAYMMRYNRPGGIRRDRGAPAGGHRRKSGQRRRDREDERCLE